MNARILHAAAIVFLASATHAAEQIDTQAPPADTQQAAPPATNTTEDKQPWVKAQAVLRATQADLQTGGIRAVEPHVADLEQVLADGPKAFAGSANGSGVVLTDGLAEMLVAMAAAATDKNNPGSKRHVIAIANPYPLLSLYLGSYYNEFGKHDDALRVLDAGMKLFAVPDLRLGQTLPLLISERGAALEGLKRWDDALANFDSGLEIKGMPDESRARLFRGRGYALTELNRLDDAEEAYKNSLKLAPDNSLALNELRYIASLRAGGLKAPSGQLTLTAPAKPQ